MLVSLTKMASGTTGLKGISGIYFPSRPLSILSAGFSFLTEIALLRKHSLAVPRVLLRIEAFYELQERPGHNISPCPEV